MSTAQHTPRPLTPRMVEELECLHRTGEPTDLWRGHASGTLAFYAREKVLSALIRRDLIVGTSLGWELTDTGRAAIKAGSTP